MACGGSNDQYRAWLNQPQKHDLWLVETDDAEFPYQLWRVDSVKNGTVYYAASNTQFHREEGFDGDVAASRVWVQGYFKAALAQPISIEGSLLMLEARQIKKVYR